MPLAESELTMGYLTEYSGLRFPLFFLAEYAGMFAMAAIASTLFLGGYVFSGLRRRSWVRSSWSARSSSWFRDHLVPVDLAPVP